MRLIIKRIVQSGMIWLGTLVLANVAYVGWGWSLGQSDAPIARPQLSGIGPSLRLLAEIPAEDLRAMIDLRPAPGLEPELEQLPLPMVCRMWGPFPSRGEIATLEQDIAAAGGESRVTETAVRGRSKYLVFVGDMGKAENAGHILKDLKSHAIDSALISRGRFNNTLSVGVFSRKDRAQRQLRRVSKLGYDAGIEEIARSSNVFHLEARVMADFEPILAPSGPCNEIAQAH